MKSLIYAEKNEYIAGMASYIRKTLPEAVIEAVTAGEPSPEQVEVLGKAGIEKIWVLDKRYQDIDAPTMSAFLAELTRKTSSSMLIVWGSKEGNEIAARTAQKLGTAYAAECLELVKKDDGYQVKRLVLGGGFIATVSIKQEPFVLTLKVLGEPLESHAKPIIEKFEPSSVEPQLETLEVVKPEAGRVELEKAEIIVSVGRGFKKKEDLMMAEELAKLLNAELGCSRPIAGDLKWMEEDRHIGLSGKRVKPRLYIALGISGQVQHLVGMRDSRTVMAVNTDPNAPMSAESDYYFVGDLYKILPLVIQLLKTRKSS